MDTPDPVPFDFSAPGVPDQIRSAAALLSPERLAELLANSLVLADLRVGCNPDSKGTFRVQAWARLGEVGLWHVEEPAPRPSAPEVEVTLYDRNGKAVPKRESPPEPKLIMTDIWDIEARSVEWLWPNRIPLAEVSIFFGRINDGKSTFLGWLTATVTEGNTWPDCPDDNPMGSVLHFQSEEQNATAVRPRVEAFGLFGRGKLIVNEGVDRGGGREASFAVTSHAEQLVKYCEEIGNVRLIIFDPIKDFINSDYSSNDDGDVTEIMLALSRVASRTGAAIVLVMHPLKDQEGDVLDSAGGSGAWMRKARAGWFLSVDPNEPKRRLLSLLKDNCEGMCQTGLAFACDRKRRSYAWISDPVELTARQAQNILRKKERDDANNAVKPKRGPDPAEHKRAEDIILKILESGPMLQSSAQDLSLNQKVTRSTFHRILTKLRKTDGRVVRFEQPGDERYWVKLRAELPAKSDDAQAPPATPADGEQPAGDPPPDPTP